ncbi:MAG: hypothetical protein ABEJ42_01820 [Halobacteriaceae archaeon]
MRLWVRAEYAEELAVLSTFLTGLLPWTVSYGDFGDLGSVFYVRFPLFQVRYSFGLPVFEAVSISDPYSAFASRGTTDIVGAIVASKGITMADGYAVWVVGAAIVLIALTFAVFAYFEPAILEPVPTVPILGSLLGLAGLVLGAAWWLLYTRGFPGPSVPVGVPIVLLLAVVLLRSERT